MCTVNFTMLYNRNIFLGFLFLNWTLLNKICNCYRQCHYLFLNYLWSKWKNKSIFYLFLSLDYLENNITFVRQMLPKSFVCPKKGICINHWVCRVELDNGIDLICGFNPSSELTQTSSELIPQGTCNCLTAQLLERLMWLVIIYNVASVWGERGAP